MKKILVMILGVLVYIAFILSCTAQKTVTEPIIASNTYKRLIKIHIPITDYTPGYTIFQYSGNIRKEYSSADGITITDSTTYRENEYDADGYLIRSAYYSSGVCIEEQIMTYEASNTPNYSFTSPL